MTGVNPRFKHGPVTYDVNVAVKGGQLVEPDGTTGKVKPATAGSAKVLGASYTDGKPETNPVGTDADGFPIVNVNGLPSQVTVDDNCWIQVTYAANAAFGDMLIAAANGQVTPAGATPDARTLVGYCAEPAGVTAGAKGLARIRR